MAKAKTRNGQTTANLGFEAKLWAAADALRNNMDAAEYKHVLLGLIFLKDGEAFDDKMKRLVGQLRQQQTEGARLDEGRSPSVFRLD